MPEDMQAAVAMDWAECLRELPWSVVDATATEWLKEKERRPVPAQFLKMADQFIREDMDDVAILRRILGQVR